ncbi:MAG: hypothetical protein EBT80_00020 [Chitinophagales bacterium]|nr:hypothetical protein [Chitinophagales bacterium]
MFEEAESAEELAQAALNELVELNINLGNDGADDKWSEYLDSMKSKSILEPSATMVDEVGKSFEGLRYFPGGETPAAVYVHFGANSGTLRVVGSFDYENVELEAENLHNVELRFSALLSGGISA